MNRDKGILFFRISMGTMMVLHGIMKIVGGIDFIRRLGGMPPGVPENDALQVVLGLTAVAFEILGGIGVATGIRFKTACVLIVLVMIPAFLYHLGNVSDFESFVRNAWPLELAFVFSAFVFIGPGKHKLA